MSALAAPARAPYQLMPALTPDERAWLRNDIEAHGVLVPVEFDEAGNILDGHHRVAIADELGIEYPTVIRSGLSEPEKIEHVVALNIVRRHLSGHDRSALIGRLRAEGWSLRAIARVVGMSHPGVKKVLDREGGNSLPPPDQEQPEPESVEEPAPEPLPPSRTRSEMAHDLAAQGMSQADIGRAMGLDPTVIQRLLKPRGNQRSPGADIPADWTQTRDWIATVRDLPSKSPDPRLVARSVPERKRASVARTLRQVGTFLGSIALELERSER